LVSAASPRYSVGDPRGVKDDLPAAPGD